MIVINSSLAIQEAEISITSIRSSGPGGQNVNKVSTAVQLRFDALHSVSLPESVRRRLVAIAGARGTKEGEIVITARRFRTREANRKDALNRLIELINRAAFQRRPRLRTSPGPGVKKRRLAAKSRRSYVKQMRSAVGADSELL